jgi:hypothetical protein
VQPKHIVLIAFLIVTTLLGGAVMLQSSTPPHEATYVEPSLRSHEAETLSVHRHRR